MSMNHDPINKKVTVYIDNLFAGVGANQQLFDLKEELVTNLKEKTSDIKSRGLDDDQAFNSLDNSMKVSYNFLKELILANSPKGGDAKPRVYDTCVRTAGLH